MVSKLDLLPQPRHFHENPELYTFEEGQYIIIDSPKPQDLLFTANKLREKLTSLKLNWEITVSKLVPEEKIGIILRLAPETISYPQGYHLKIDPQKIVIEGHDNAGLFYGTCSLCQLLEQVQSPKISILQIEDWPDFPARGVMLDISRDKVPTMQTLYALVDLLASWKINQLQLYTEHTFAYLKHPVVWEKATPMTGADILALDNYCQERFIELVPNQNSFGHMHRWFKHEKYAPLGELVGYEIERWWGKGSYSLCPLDPGSVSLLEELYAELLPHFSSKMFNVGCDETFDLGLGRSKAECEKSGKGRVYLNFLTKIFSLVKSHGKTMQFWGDIIMEHPELVSELPKDIIALEWGYEADQPPAGHCEEFARSAVPFYVCPGTSSWNSIAGRTANALGNLSLAALNGKEYGAIGYLITDWGDHGHWQVLPISYLGFAAGAAFSWSYPANKDIDIKTALNKFAFHDTSSILGKLSYELGNIYQAVGITPHNASILFHVLQMPIAEIKKYIPDFSPNTFRDVEEHLQQVSNSLDLARPQTSDASLLHSEFRQSIRLLKHACLRSLYAFEDPNIDPEKLDLDLREILIEYQEIWLARNRIGGLLDSLKRFDVTRQDYIF